MVFIISLTDNMYMVLDVIKAFVLYMLCGTMVLISVIGHSEGVCICYRMYMLIIWMYMLIIRYVRSAKRLNGEVLYIIQIIIDRIKINERTHEDMNHSNYSKWIYHIVMIVLCTCRVHKTK